MKKGLIALLAVLLTVIGCSPKQASDYSWEEDLAYRESVDFSWTPERVKEYIQKYIPDVTDEQIAAWTENGPLEAKMIDGKLMYFNRTAAGLFLVDPQCRAIKEGSGNKSIESASLSGNSLDSDEQAEMDNMKAIIEAVKSSGNPIAEGVKMKVKYTITVDADAVPAGEKIRCWLPFPRKDVARQQDVKFLGANRRYKFSDPACEHSTLYMEARAVAGEPTVFSEEFEYTEFGEWNKITPEMVKPYDTTTELYKKYTSEREKHIIFSDRLRGLADSLTAGIENPYLQARAIFEWVDKKFPWSGAREYSTLENIPEYVLDAGHGDCGQVTLLYCTLCRIKGIPTHFQSGFVMDKSGWNLHDWCETYFEGVGWVPVDQSAGIREYAWDEDSRYFFFGGTDNYRMVVNQDFGCELSPKKIYPRSETVDFQRGEVEWKGGNLYFPFWDYEMDIEYLD